MRAAEINEPEGEKSEDGEQEPVEWNPKFDKKVV